jgi:putative membrane protein
MGSGMLAICAMLLPGISGSFLLLILGAYEPVLVAIKSLDVTKIAAFGLGAVMGLLAFSRGLKWLLATHRRPALATLTGFLVGSLQALWPWKEGVRPLYTHSDGRVEWLLVNVSPAPMEVWTAVTWMCVGAAVVWGIHRWGEANKQSS